MKQCKRCNKMVSPDDIFIEHKQSTVSGQGSYYSKEEWCSDCYIKAYQYEPYSLKRSPIPDAFLAAFPEEEAITP